MSPVETGRLTGPKAVWWNTLGWGDMRFEIILGGHLDLGKSSRGFMESNTAKQLFIGLLVGGLFYHTIARWSSCNHGSFKGLPWVEAIHGLHRRKSQ